MTPLKSVALRSPVRVHNFTTKLLEADQIIYGPDGPLPERWDLHLHQEWQCIVVELGLEVCLIPLHLVESMQLQSPIVAVSEPMQPRGPGRPRTKRLDVVRD